MSMIKNTFCVKVIYNENHEITTEYKKPIKRDTIDEVNTNIIEMDINNIQQEQMNISCTVKETEVKEEQKEEVKEEQQEEPEQQEEEPEEPKKDEPEEEEQKKDKTLSIEELKETLTEKLEKRIPLLVMVELSNKCIIILKLMIFIHYYKKKKTLSILLKTNIKRTYPAYPASYAVF